MFNNIKVYLISGFSLVTIELVEKLNEVNVIIELIIQGLIGILTIFYLIIKIKNSYKK